MRWEMEMIGVVGLRVGKRVATMNSVPTGPAHSGRPSCQGPDHRGWTPAWPNPYRPTTPLLNRLGALSLSSLRPRLFSPFPFPSPP